MKPESSTLLALLSGSDEELVLQALQEKAALAELYHRNFGRVYRYLFSAFGEISSTQDLTMQTFLEARDRLPTFRHETSFASWLIGIARSQAAGRMEPKTSMEQIPEILKPSPTKGTETDNRLQLSEVIHALQRLQPERADAIRLTIFAGLKAAETGSIMKKDDAAVKMLLLIGLRELRDLLAPTMEIEP